MALAFHAEGRAVSHIPGTKAQACWTEVDDDAATSLRRELRQLRADMRAAGVRKVSPFNGGLSPAEYAMNRDRFRLETALARAEGDT